MHCFYYAEVDFFQTFSRPETEELPVKSPQHSVKNFANGVIPEDPSDPVHVSEDSSPPQTVARRKNKPAPVPPSCPRPGGKAVEPSAKDPFIVTQQNSAENSEKREGVWLPGSPITQTRGSLNKPPPKPPQPKLGGQDVSSGLRHKSSFKTEKSSPAPVSISETQITDQRDFRSLPRRFTNNPDRSMR